MLKNVFNLYLNSKQSLEGSTAPTGSLNYDLGSIQQLSPLISQYANLGYCYIKLKTMNINNNSPAVSTQASSLQITANLPQPCSATTQTLTPKKYGLASSNIIGLFPTNSGGTLYNPSYGYHMNDWVKVGNPFKGVVNIRIKDQDGVDLTLNAVNNYQMLLQVYFDESS